MPSSVGSGSISPDSIRVPTPTANDFPTPAGQIFAVTKRDQGLVSPSRSSFSFQDVSFPDEEHSVHAISTSLDQLEQKTPYRHIDRGAPGDASFMSIFSGTPQQDDLRRKKSQYYTDVFAYREPNLSPKDRIFMDAVITAEVKTNVIIKDEYEFLQDVSHHLSLRYQRPESSIFVTLDHSACLLYAGTFDPAYILTISALPAQLLPTTNKRNAALMQAFLADPHLLGVSAARGVVRFIPVADEYLAFNGTTVCGQIENLQKAPVSRKTSRVGVSPMEQRQQQLWPRRKDLPLREETSRTPVARASSPHLLNAPLPAIPTEKSALDKRAEKVQKLGKRRSFLAMFGK